MLLSTLGLARGDILPAAKPRRKLGGGRKRPRREPVSAAVLTIMSLVAGDHCKQRHVSASSAGAVINSFFRFSPPLSRKEAVGNCWRRLYRCAERRNISRQSHEPKTKTLNGLQMALLRKGGPLYREH